MRAKRVSLSNDVKFVVDADNHKFLLFWNGTPVAESGFDVKEPDRWFGKRYVTLYELETYERFRRRGFAKKLLTGIFDYVSDYLGIDVISLIVYKDNPNALMLYKKCGFKKLMEYKDSYSLVKRLRKKSIVSISINV